MGPGCAALYMHCTGSTPPLHFSSADFLYMRVHARCCAADAAAVEAHARSILEAAGRDPNSIAIADVKHFCKHARYLRWMPVLLIQPLVCSVPQMLLTVHWTLRARQKLTCQPTCSPPAPSLRSQAGALAVAGRRDRGGQLPRRGAAQRSVGRGHSRQCSAVCAAAGGGPLLRDIPALPGGV